jgi:hypothetical protein
VFALGKIGRGALSARPRLVACQGDEDETVRAEVIRSLTLLDEAN